LCRRSSQPGRKRYTPGPPSPKGTGTFLRTYGELASAFGRCTGCHASTLVGATARYAAPDGTDYDTYEGAKQQAEAPKGKDLVSRIQDGTMPLSPMPGGNFQGTEKQDLITWAQCGTPQ